MEISKVVFFGSIVLAAATGVAGGIIAGIKIGKNKVQNEIDEANAMAELWKKRAQRKQDEETYDTISKSYDSKEEESSEKPVKHTRHESRDYTKYYSRKDLVDDSQDDEEEEVVSVNPKPNIDDPPKIVSQDEAMSPDSDCMELEYHIKDEALIDPNVPPGTPELIDPVDAFMMVGNLLRLPDPSQLPKTVYVYSPKRDQYYEIYIYNNFYDPPDEYEDAPRTEKIRKRGRFDD